MDEINALKDKNTKLVKELESANKSFKELFVEKNKLHDNNLIL